MPVTRDPWTFIGSRVDVERGATAFLRHARGGMAAWQLPNRTNTSGSEVLQT